MHSAGMKANQTPLFVWRTICFYCYFIYFSCTNISCCCSNVLSRL